MPWITRIDGQGPTSPVSPHGNPLAVSGRVPARPRCRPQPREAQGQLVPLQGLDDTQRRLMFSEGLVPCKVSTQRRLMFSEGLVPCKVSSHGRPRGHGLMSGKRMASSCSSVTRVVPAEKS